MSIEYYPYAISKLYTAKKAHTQLEAIKPFLSYPSQERGCLNYASAALENIKDHWW